MNGTNLDPYQVRTDTGWYRHTTVSMLAQALLAVLHARANSPLALASLPANASGLAPLTVHEIRRRGHPTPHC